MPRDWFHDLAEDLVHGAEESYVADLTEEMLGLLEQGMADPDRYAVLAMRSKEAAMAVWARHTAAVTAEARAAFERALTVEDEDISDTLAEGFSAPAHITNRAANEVMEAARGLSEIIGRQNVALADGLADTWWRVTADAVARTQLGDDPRDVMEGAVSRLAAAGLETIDYRSGVKTTIDAAVRRHTITQANQCRNHLLLERCGEYGVELVFTSAHWGCRPAHAPWQGKPFSLHGAVEVDGVAYRDLAEATGYGTVGGLCGANCRHRLTPYVPGLSKLPDTDFKAFEEKYRMSSDEYYEATQKQRALERRIRRTKREIALGQERGLDMTEARYRLGAQQKRLREHCARTGLPRDPERERAYGVKRQPRALNPQSKEYERRQSAIADAKEHPLVKPKSGDTNRYTVDYAAVNSGTNRLAYESLPYSHKARRGLRTEAGKILTERDGTRKETLSAIDAKTGRRVVDTRDHAAEEGQANFSLAAREKLAMNENPVILIHNHSGSSEPSGADCVSVCTNKKVIGSVIQCHNGDVYNITPLRSDGIKEAYIEYYEIGRMQGMARYEAERYASDRILDRNEEEKWFRITRLPISSRKAS